MSEQSGWDDVCPYCGAEPASLTYHLPCEETPPTDEVFEALQERGL